MARLRLAKWTEASLVVLFATLVHATADDAQVQGRILAEVEAHGVAAASHDDSGKKGAPSLMRRDMSAEPAKPIETPFKHGTCAPWYERALRDDNAVAMYPCNEITGDILHAYGTACGSPGWEMFGGKCQVNGNIIGNQATTPTQQRIQFQQKNLIPCPLEAPTASPNMIGDFSLRFSPSNISYRNVIALPSNVDLDSDAGGYPEYTVGLWMEAEACDATARTLVRSGHPDKTGFHIYTIKNTTTNECRLKMFAWNHVSSHDPSGNRFIGLWDDLHQLNVRPLECTIAENKPYYVAFVFAAKQSGSTYTGYIAGQGQATVQQCDTVNDLIVMAKLGRMSEGSQAITIGGGPFGNTTMNFGEIVAENNALTRLSATESTTSQFFEGYIQWVSFFREALTEAKMNKQLEAARGQNKPADQSLDLHQLFHDAVAGNTYNHEDSRLNASVVAAMTTPSPHAFR